jgi:hypothetical protein
MAKLSALTFSLDIHSKGIYNDPIESEKTNIQSKVTTMTNTMTSAMNDLAEFNLTEWRKQYKSALREWRKSLKKGDLAFANGTKVIGPIMILEWKPPARSMLYSYNPQDYVRAVYNRTVEYVLRDALFPEMQSELFPEHLLIDHTPE